MMPGNAAGSTTVNIARARVAPSASAPSLSEPGHQEEQFLGGAHDERNHHDPEGEPAGEGRECLEGQHGDPEDEHADDD